MNIDTGCDQCYAIHIYLDCLASKFLTKMIRVRREPELIIKEPFLAWESRRTLVQNFSRNVV